MYHELGIARANRPLEASTHQGTVCAWRLKHPPSSIGPMPEIFQDLTNLTNVSLHNNPLRCAHSQQCCSSTCYSPSNCNKTVKYFPTNPFRQHISPRTSSTPARRNFSWMEGDPPPRARVPPHPPASRVINNAMVFGSTFEYRAASVPSLDFHDANQFMVAFWHTPCQCMDKGRGGVG